MGVIKKGKPGNVEIIEYNLSFKQDKTDPKSMKRAIEAKQRIIKRDRVLLSQKAQVILRDPGKPKPVVKSVIKDGKLTGIDVICTCGERIKVNFDFEF